jgi:hypothetical protein
MTKVKEKKKNYWQNQIKPTFASFPIQILWPLPRNGRSCYSLIIDPFVNRTRGNLFERLWSRHFSYDFFHRRLWTCNSGCSVVVGLCLQ